MNKFLECTILCLLVTPAWGMEKLWRKEFGNGPAKARKLREKLPSEERAKLNMQLWKAVDPYFYRDVPDACARLKVVLNRGADPKSDDLALRKAALSPNNGKGLVNLLLAYGANPHQKNAITQARSIGALRIFLQAGVDINTVSEETLLSALCGYDFDEDLEVLAWALLHHADPNLLPQNTPDKCCYEPAALYKALDQRNVSKVIALLQYGAQLNTTDERYGTPLKFAQTLSLNLEDSELGTLARRAQCELLHAIGENHLDPNNLTEEECKAAGITDESTRLIVAAAQRVADAFRQCKEEDEAYERAAPTYKSK